MRFLIITIIAISLMLCLGLTGNNKTGNVFVGAVFADSQGLSEISVDDDELEEFWKFFIIGNEDDENEEDAEETPEEEEEEEESESDEESTDDDEEFDDEESSFLDFLTSGDSESSDSQDEEDTDSSSTDDESADMEMPDDINIAAVMESKPENWHKVPGVKVPFFFLMNADTPGINDADEPVVARLKALKAADQMTNGISFKYEIASGDVYLTENMVEIPEFVHMVDRIEYIGVSRFEYEVAIPENIVAGKTSGRRVVVVGEKRSKNLALSFEAARKEAFTKAVETAFIKEHLDKDSDREYQTGTIAGWEVLSEGWKAESDSFYLQLRVWVEFDR